VALVFRDSEALQVILRSDLCSPDLTSRGAKVARDEAGALILAPERPLPAPVLQKLRAAGVTVADLPGEARDIRCWAEAIAPVRAQSDIPSLVLFAVEKPDDLLALTADLVRLGCDRVELCIEHGLARVVDPPTYTVVRAIDHESNLRVYAPDPPGQDATWTELNYRHPLAASLNVASGTLLLIPGPPALAPRPPSLAPRPSPLAPHPSPLGPPPSPLSPPPPWRALSPSTWHPLDAAVTLTIPGGDHALTHSPLSHRFQIELRLAAGRREAPSLWVIRDNALATVDKLLSYLPDEVVARLTFAATADDPPTIILRTRTSRHAPPDLALAAEEYAPLAHMPDVYAPANALVEPPMRRERLRAKIGVASGEVVWLARTTGDKFRIERTTDAAFVPLAEWADYVIHASAAAFAPWLRAAQFDFTPFVSTGVEWASGPAADSDADNDAHRKPRARPRADAPAGTPPPQAPRPTAAPRTQPPRPATEVTVAAIPIDEELAKLEADFVALDAPGDAPERIALLERLGHLYARLGRRRDAGLCFARAVWESGEPQASTRLDTWIAEHLQGEEAGGGLSRALAATEPAPDDIRLVATLTARSHPAVRQDPHRVTRWLDDHDGELDARTLWLSRLGLATIAGGDLLGLAHTRDRILARLAGGLPVERELPAFLRFAGRSGALGNASGEHLSNALEQLAQRIAKTRRKRHPTERPDAPTNAYIGFLLAHGFARIGKQERARALVEESRQALAQHASDPVHAYLGAAFTARVEQALAGLPAETPLPDALAAQAAALNRDLRYKVDRLRESLRILDPLAGPAAAAHNYSLDLTDSRGPEFATLRTVTDPAARTAALATLISTAATNEAERERLLGGVFESLLASPVTTALPLLARAWPLIAEVKEPQRAALYARALVVAGHFGNTELVPELVARLAETLPAVSTKDLEHTLHNSLRALRRIGLRREIAELLDRVEQALPQTRDVAAIRIRLSLAAGLAYLGAADRAQPIFEQARQAFGDISYIQARIDLVRALALAYAQMPLQFALGGIAELSTQFRDITDAYGTNSHYSLSVLHFVESLVLGITSDDLALGEAGRRFVEDDEHLIRRRLHHDLKGRT
jgi:hypothetical protein